MAGGSGLRSLPRRSVAYNTALNAGGALLSIGLALVCIPIFLRELGEVRYGVLALIWLVFGYLGIFDLGIGKAVVTFLSRSQNRADERQAEILRSAIGLTAVFSCAGGVLVYLAGSAALPYVEAIPQSYQMEVSEAIGWVALLIPVAATYSLLLSILESQERFVEANVLGVLNGIAVQMVPLGAIMALGPTLPNAVCATLLARIGAMCPLAFIALGSVPLLFRQRWRTTGGRSLLSFGSWTTLTNISSPLLLLADQFTVSGIVGVRNVVYYIVPFNLVTKAFLLPQALVRSLLPVLSALPQADARGRASAHMVTLAWLMAMLVMPAFFLVGPWLAWWINPEFANEATNVAQVLLMAVFISSASYIPLTLLQATGRPGQAALIHAVQVFPYLAFVWVAVEKFGLEGAALAWGIRSVVDVVGMSFAAGIPVSVFWKMIRPLGLVVAASIICYLYELTTFEALLTAAAALLITVLCAIYFDERIRSRVALLSLRSKLS